jgi:tetratricopeptide (TPR) repeat protein
VNPTAILGFELYCVWMRRDRANVAAPPSRRADGMHGRARELDAIVEVARRRSASCVTITGMIGIGKSRLLDEARRRLSAEGIAARFWDGGPTDDPPIDRAATTVLLVASAIALGVPREREVPLGALPTPGSDLAAVRRSAACVLLADAARLELDALGADELRAIGRVAEASDGHPAVLEQLAGWLALLSPLETVTALEEGTLGLVPSKLALRLRGLVHALDSDAREVLAAVAEMVAPFDLGAARAVIRASRRPKLPSTLARLVAGGWLLREGRPEAPRWRVIAPFRAILRGRRGDEARGRLTDHFARQARPLLELAVTDRTRVAPLLEARAGVVASWEDAHARGDDAELVLAASLAAIATSGDADVARHAVRIASSLAAHPRTPHRARLEIAHGDALWFSGDVRGADERFGGAATRARRDGHLAVEALAWVRRATLGPELGRIDVAEKQLERGSRLAARCDQPRVLVLAMGIRGFLLRARGDIAGALTAFDEQAELARRAGDVFYTASADANAADCHLVLGERALGRDRYESARRAMKRVDPGWARTIEGYMGLAAWEVEAHGEAVSRLGRALGGRIAPRFRVVFAAARAGVLAALGELARARSALARAEEAAIDHGPNAPIEAVRAATLLVRLAHANDVPSRRAVTRAISDWLAAREGSIAEDERPFHAALARGVKRPDRNTGGGLFPASVLDGRPRLARVYAVLAARAGRGPVSAADLFRAAWPEETRLDHGAADARVRKAVSLLRALGLRGSIVTTDGGYALRS